MAGASLIPVPRFPYNVLSSTLYDSSTVYERQLFI
jgi:hypothetical protein